MKIFTPNPFIQFKKQKCDHSSHNCTGNDIRNEMHAQINTRIAVDGSPEDGGNRNPFIAK
jgi:hypothetical protein